MNTSDSLTEFFYNIVPGGLFVLGICFLLEYFPFKDDVVLFIFLLVIFGLFFGFIFQWFTKRVRDGALNIHDLKNSTVWAKVAEKSKLKYGGDYRCAFEKLEYLIDNKQNQSSLKNIKRNLYLMHNYLRAEGKAEAPNFFAARLAFWANTFFTTLLLSIFGVFKFIFQLIIITCHRNIDSTDILITVGFIIFNIFIFIISKAAFGKYLYILHDVVLKTFIVVVKTKNKNNKAK